MLPLSKWENQDKSHSRGRELLKPPKPAKPPKPSTTGRAVCNARFLLREVHVSGALSGACTGKGPQIANPRPTPKPGNLGPPWPPGTSGDPAGYSRGRPLGGSR